MSQKGQELTKSVYEDPELVASYVERHVLSNRMNDRRQRFIDLLNGKKIIDIGCGPGHDSYHFAESGFEVVGVDYSSEMIKVAKQLKKMANAPQFTVADMRNLGELFPENTFDGAWISASLIHIPESEVPTVLKSVQEIVKKGGKVYIGLKGGSRSTQMIHDTKYNKPVDREFTFWEKEVFSELVKKLGFVIISVDESISGITGTKATNWLHFVLEVKK